MFGSLSGGRISLRAAFVRTDHRAEPQKAKGQEMRVTALPHRFFSAMR